MKFADIVAGIDVFLDANTFVYHFISEPTFGAPCTDLLKRIEQRDVMGWTTPHVLAEVSHRLMTIEACSLFGWSYQGIAARLRRHPQHLQQLSRFQSAIEQIATLGLRNVLVAEQQLSEAAKISRQFGLLTNDALIVAIMNHHNLVHLASNDADFDKLPHIVRYSPI